MLIPLLVVAGLIALPYVAAPLVVRARFRHRSEPEVEAVAVETVATPARQALGQVALSLQACGFEQTAWARVTAVEGVETWIAHFRHLGREDLALASAFLSGGKLQMQSLEFRTAWAGGKQYLTNNYGDVPAFGPTRGQAVVTLPGMCDVAMLYRIHHARVRHDGPMASPEIPIDTDGLDVVREAYANWIEAQRMRRNLVPDGKRPHMDRLTWLGAFRAAFRQMPPMRQILMSRIRERGTRVVHALDLDDARAHLDHGPLESSVRSETA